MKKKADIFPVKSPLKRKRPSISKLEYIKPYELDTAQLRDKIREIISDGENLTAYEVKHLLGNVGKFDDESLQDMTHIINNQISLIKGSGIDLEIGITGIFRRLRPYLVRNSIQQFNFLPKKIRRTRKIYAHGTPMSHISTYTKGNRLVIKK